jgi:competence protein ComEC
MDNIRFALNVPLLAWPVGLGTGVMLYHAPYATPPVWCALVLAVMALLACMVECWRQRPASLGLMLALASLGFSGAWWQVEKAYTPLIRETVENAVVQGRVALLEPRERGVRLVLEDVRIVKPDWVPVPRKLRLSTFMELPLVEVGDRVEMRAQLQPLHVPILPGEYDPARSLYLQGIGGTGFITGTVRLIEGPVQENHEWMEWFERLRTIAGEEMAEVLPPDIAGIGQAMMLGQNSAMKREVYEPVRQAGLAHIIAISGFHMALVAGIAMVALRRGLALVPWCARHLPLKAIAALLSLLLTTFYLLMTGMPVSAVRSWIMIVVVMLAIMLGREVNPMRLLALAAVVLLVINPAALLTAGFQMSFAAVWALVVLYHFWQPKALVEPGARNIPAPVRVMAKLGRGVIGVAAASLAAGLATAPFTLYHFHTVSFTGLVANMLAVPLASFWIMPFGVLALLLMPLGLAKLPLVAMGMGLGWMQDIAIWCNEALGWLWSVPNIDGWVVVLLALGALVAMFRPRVGGVMALLAIGWGVWQAVQVEEKPVPVMLLTPTYMAMKADDGAWWLNGKTQEGNFIVKRWKEHLEIEEWNYLCPPKFKDILPEKKTKSGKPRKPRKPRKDSKPKAPPKYDACKDEAVLARIEPLRRCDREGCVYLLPGGYELDEVKDPGAWGDACDWAREDEKRFILLRSGVDMQCGDRVLRVGDAVFQQRGPLAIAVENGRLVAEYARDGRVRRPWVP